MFNNTNNKLATTRAQQALTYTSSKVNLAQSSPPSTLSNGLQLTGFKKAAV